MSAHKESVYSKVQPPDVGESRNSMDMASSFMKDTEFTVSAQGSVEVVPMRQKPQVSRPAASKILQTRVRTKQPQEPKHPSSVQKSASGKVSKKRRNESRNENNMEILSNLSAHSGLSKQQKDHMSQLVK